MSSTLPLAISLYPSPNPRLYSLQLPLLDSNETDGLIGIGGLIGINVIWSHFIVW